MTKNGFIYALKTSGCLYHNGQTYYEENELIRTFEDMEMFEEEKSLKDMTKLEHAIKHIKTRADAWAVKEVTEALQSISERLDKALSQEPGRVKNELNVELNELKPCTDAVSREAVAKWFCWVNCGKDMCKVDKKHCVFMQGIDALPLVQPKRQTGRWKVHRKYYECSSCGSQISNEFFVNYRFCPHCGARMESEK